MRAGIKIFILAAVFLAFAGCGRPREIPDATLREITKDIFLSNAYVTEHRGTVRMDSLDIYTPIFRKYGYTIKDFHYTLSTFAKRKSVRLSDIIKQASDELDAEAKFYQKRIDLLDSIDILIGEKFRTKVKVDSLIRATRIQDTSRLKVTIPLQEGKYRISFNYLIDSLDMNNGQRISLFTIDSAGRHTLINSQWMTHRERQRKEMTVDATPHTKKLLINFGTYPKTAVSPLDVTIDSLVIVRYLPRQVALDSINRLLVNYKLLIDGKEYDRLAADSLAADVRPPWISAGDGGERR